MINQTNTEENNTDNKVSIKHILYIHVSQCMYVMVKVVVVVCVLRELLYVKKMMT